MRGGARVTPRPWTAEQLALLEKLRADNIEWPVIAGQVGHSAASCCTTFSQRNGQRRVVSQPATPKPARPQGEPGSPWNARDIGIAARIWQQDYADHYDTDDAPRGVLFRVMQRIALEIGCEYARVYQRHRDCGPSFLSGGHRKDVANQALLERDKRKLAADLRSVTASIFGDPPPGYSALDKRARP